MKGLKGSIGFKSLSENEDVKKLQEELDAITFVADSMSAELFSSVVPTNAACGWILSSAGVSSFIDLSNELPQASSTKDLMEKDLGMHLLRKRLRCMALKDILEKDEVFDGMWGGENDYDTQE